MKYTPSFFSASMPTWKKKKDPILSRLFYRPLSYWISAPIASVGISANTVSFFSLIISLGACILFSLGLPVFGALLTNIWLLLDCVDGNIARSIKKQKYGEFADALSSYVCMGLLFSCVGYCIYVTGGAVVNSGAGWIVLFGAVASACDSLMRLTYQKYQVVGYRLGVDNHIDENPENEKGISAVRIKVDGYMSLGGILPAALLLASIAHALDLLLFIWAAYYVLTCTATIFYLIRKTVDANMVSK